MNVKLEQDRAIKYVKIRMTAAARDNFKACCEVTNTTMTDVLASYINNYIANNMQYVKK